jgi:hypothetical protein
LLQEERFYSNRKNNQASGHIGYVNMARIRQKMVFFYREEGTKPERTG